MRSSGLSLAAILAIAVPASGKVEVEFREKIEPFLQDYCYDCHGDGAKKGDIALDDFKNVSSHLENHELWLRIWSNVRTHLMPPIEGDFQPSPEERGELMAWIESNVLKLDPENPDPGRVTIRRLNREEYRNTIQDLVGVDYNVDDNFPPDDTGFGFDTIGDVLTISPLLLEKYLMAAETVADLALPSTVVRRRPITIDAGNFRERGNNQQSARFMEADKKHTVGAERRFSRAGVYNLQVNYRIENERGRPEGQTAIWRILVDGKEIESVQVDGGKRSSGEFKTEIELSEGNHRFEFSMVPGSPGEGEGTWGVRVEDCKLVRQAGSEWALYPESYRRIFFKGLPPEEKSARDAYLREIVREFASKAFRRPAEDRFVDALTALALDRNQDDGAKFVDGVKLAVTATLTSPRFLFRREVQAEPDNPGRVVPVDQFALASRLSYFLWSGPPDAELLQIAKQNRLHLPEVLRQQVNRMIADPRSDAFVAGFVHQWLDMERLDFFQFDVNLYRDFDESTRAATREEVYQSFAHLLRDSKEGSLGKLLKSDYIFANGLLATYYDLEGVSGDEFRKIKLPADSPRGGLLGMAAIHAMGSDGVASSPVERGAWVLRHLLNDPPPPAPPNVPQISRLEGQTLTTRERLLAHQEEAQCASCHRKIDPIGFGLENFNAAGKWRTEDSYQMKDARGRGVGQRKTWAIDASGAFHNGPKFSDYYQLRDLIASREQDFARGLTENLVEYALGRPFGFTDEDLANEIVISAQSSDFSVSEFIHALVQSEAFRTK